MSNVQPKAQGGSPSNAQGEAAQAEPAAQSPGRGSVPMGQRGAIYTMTAREGLNASELVNATLAKKTVGKLTPRRVEVAAPDGPSTSGGKRARQTIRLVPATGSGAPVMCGFLDVGQKAVELRAYRTVATQFKERFGSTLDVTLDEYNALIKDLEATFSVFQYAVTHEPEQTDASPAQAATPRAARAELTAPDPSERRSPLLNIVLILFSLAMVVGLGFVIFTR